MNNTLQMARLTFKEALSKKMFLIIFILTSVAIGVYFLITLFTSQLNFNPSDPQAAKMVPKEPGLMMLYMWSGTINLLGVLLGIFITTGLIPDMTKKGIVDIYLSRPLSRIQLLTGRLLGIFGIVLILIYYPIIGSWLITGFSVGTWNAGFLISGFFNFFNFFVLFSIASFLAIISGRSVLSIIMAIVIFIILSPTIKGLLFLTKTDLDIQWVKTLLNVLHQIVPKTSEIGDIAANIAGNMPVESYWPLFSTFLFAAVFYFAAFYLFSKKDF